MAHTDIGPPVSSDTPTLVDGKDLSDLDARFTDYYIRRERVEVIWKKGHENHMGYGARTNGKKARFWVGRSTGTKPVYLQIPNRNSRGGISICSDSVESVRGLYTFMQKPLR